MRMYVQIGLLYFVKEMKKIKEFVGNKNIIQECVGIFALDSFIL